MTLQRELLIIIFILFLTVFSGTFVITEVLNRDYYEDQLQVTASDAAISLGIMLSTQLSENDIPSATSIIDAIFDRGYYQTIQLRDMKGNMLIDRNKPVQIHNVPQWFVKLLPINSPANEALVVSGWREIGKVYIRAHPGYAYKQLWDTSVAFLIWYVTLSVLIFLLGVVAIHYLMRPLKAITKQVKAIMSGEFPIQRHLPRTLQLRELTIAMNRMTSRLERQFDEQRQITAQLRKRVYHDPVTDLGNRNYFNTHLQHVITHSEEEVRATVFLIEVTNLAQYNEHNGYDAGDTLLQHITKIISNSIEQKTRVFLARISGTTFALLQLDTQPEQVREFGKKLVGQLSQIAAEDAVKKSGLTINIGSVDCHKGMSAHQILSAADTALISARSKGEFTHEQISSDSLTVESESDWRKTLSHIIANKQFSFHFQPCFSRDRSKVLHYEMLCRAIDQAGRARSAALLFPMAERLDMTRDLDKALISEALTIAALPENGDKVFAINISPGSLYHNEFLLWLYTLLNRNKETAARMIFEINEFSAINTLDKVKELIETVSPLGVRISLAHFGRAATAFSYLRATKVSFVKLDSSFIRNIDQNEDNEFYIQSLIRVAHGLDIPVHADKIELVTEYQKLVELGIDGVQGLYLSPPVAELPGS